MTTSRSSSVLQKKSLHQLGNQFTGFLEEAVKNRQLTVTSKKMLLQSLQESTTAKKVFGFKVKDVVDPTAEEAFATLVQDKYIAGSSDKFASGEELREAYKKSVINHRSPAEEDKQIAGWMGKLEASLQKREKEQDYVPAKFDSGEMESNFERKIKSLRMDFLQRILTLLVVMRTAMGGHEQEENLQKMSLEEIQNFIYHQDWFWQEQTSLKSKDEEKRKKIISEFETYTQELQTKYTEYIKKTYADLVEQEKNLKQAIGGGKDMLFEMENGTLPENTTASSKKKYEKLKRTYSKKLDQMSTQLETSQDAQDAYRQIDEYLTSFKEMSSSQEEMSTRLKEYMSAINFTSKKSLTLINDIGAHRDKLESTLKDCNMLHKNAVGLGDQFESWSTTTSTLKLEDAEYLKRLFKRGYEKQEGLVQNTGSLLDFGGKLRKELYAFHLFSKTKQPTIDATKLGLIANKLPERKKVDQITDTKLVLDTLQEMLSSQTEIEDMLSGIHSKMRDALDVTPLQQDPLQSFDEKLRPTYDALYDFSVLYKKANTLHNDIEALRTRCSMLPTILGIRDEQNQLEQLKSKVSDYSMRFRRDIHTLDCNNLSLQLYNYFTTLSSNISSYKERLQKFKHLAELDTKMVTEVNEQIKYLEQRMHPYKMVREKYLFFKNTENRKSKISVDSDLFKNITDIEKDMRYALLNICVLVGEGKELFASGPLKVIWHKNLYTLLVYGYRKTFERNNHIGNRLEKQGLTDEFNNGVFVSELLENKTPIMITTPRENLEKREAKNPSVPSLEKTRRVMSAMIRFWQGKSMELPQIVSLMRGIGIEPPEIAGGLQLIGLSYTDIDKLFEARKESLDKRFLSLQAIGVTHSEIAALWEFTDTGRRKYSPYNLTDDFVAAGVSYEEIIDRLVKMRISSDQINTSLTSKKVSPETIATIRHKRGKAYQDIFFMLKNARLGATEILTTFKNLGMERSEAVNLNVVGKYEIEEIYGKASK